MRYMDRRALLAGSFAIGATTAMDAWGATPRRTAGAGFFQRIKKPIGLQVYTLGDQAGRDLDKTFAQVAAIGYREIELPSLYQRSAREVRAAADKAGLVIRSLHLAVSTRGQPAGASFASSPAEIADTVLALGASHAVAPIAVFPQGMRPQAGESMQAVIVRAFATAGEAPWRQTADLINPVAVALKPQGVRVGYHNHNIEFAPIAGGTTGGTS